jgi:hypothetical protein
VIWSCSASSIFIDLFYAQPHASITRCFRVWMVYYAFSLNFSKKKK